MVVKLLLFAESEGTKMISFCLNVNIVSKTKENGVEEGVVIYKKTAQYKYVGKPNHRRSSTHMLIDGIFSHSQQAQSWHLVPGFCPRVQAQLSLVMANPIAASSALFLPIYKFGVWWGFSRCRDSWGG